MLMYVKDGVQEVLYNNITVRDILYVAFGLVSQVVTVLVWVFVNRKQTRKLCVFEAMHTGTDSRFLSNNSFSAVSWPILMPNTAN